MRTLLPLFLVITSCASAQIFEAGAFGGASRLSGKQIGSFLGETGNVPIELKDGWRFGFRIALNNWRFFGHEFGYAYNRTSLRFVDTPPTEAGMAFHQPFYSFLAYALPEGSPVRPFVAGGGHVSNFIPPGSSVTQGGGDNKFGYHYGGGIKVRVKTNWGIRFDVRQYVTGKPFDLPGADGKLRQMEISAGFMFMM